MQRKINLTRWFVDKWEKPCKTKTPMGDFKVTISKNLLINNQAVTSIRNLTNYLAYAEIPTYSWTFASILNWTWFYSSLLSFDVQTFNFWLTLCTDLSTWLTPTTWTDVVGYKILHFINNEDLKALDYKTLWRTNIVTSHRKNKSLGICIHVWWLLK